MKTTWTPKDQPTKNKGVLVSSQLQKDVVVMVGSSRTRNESEGGAGAVWGKVGKLRRKSHACRKVIPFPWLRGEGDILSDLINSIILNMTNKVCYDFKM